MNESEPIRILCMEDDPGAARLVQKVLERAGYVVDIACNGLEGLEMHKTGSYALLLVDQSMPVVEGLEVLRRLSSLGSTTPLIMITGHGDERLAVEAMKLGARDYIVKDTGGGFLELLPSVVRRVFQQQQLMEEKLRVEEERERLIQELENALAQVKTLSGLLPICASCKKIRDDRGYWNQIENYITSHSDARFSHGICPECARKLYGDFYK